MDWDFIVLLYAGLGTLIWVFRDPIFNPSGICQCSWSGCTCGAEDRETEDMI